MRQSLKREEIAKLDAAVESRFFEFGDTVYNAGDLGDGVYAIKSGAVRIFTEERGKEISMGVRKQGELFAEIALLREVRHESSVRASSKTELLYIPRTAIEPVLEGNQEARSFIANYVAISSVGGWKTNPPTAGTKCSNPRMPPSQPSWYS